MIIGFATIDDFQELYTLGKNTPEFMVSATEDFMSEDEFRWSIQNPDGIFLVAKDEDKIIGFIYATTKDIERTRVDNYSCIVYIVIRPEFRGNGIATSLYNACVKKLKIMGITHLYCWASADGKEVKDFMKKQGFNEGHTYVWMDKAL